MKTLTDAGASEPLAVAVVDVAREASKDATGELVTRAHFDTALAQLGIPPRLAPGELLEFLRRGSRRLGLRWRCAA